MDWQVIITLIIALITGFVAYVNYRTRPLLVRTKEKHSEDLKTVLERWLSELVEKKPAIPHWRELHESWNPCLDVETEPLFLDLEEHLPAGVSPLAEWRGIKKTCGLYNTRRSELYHRVWNDVHKGGQLSLAEEVLTEEFVLHIYLEAGRVAHQESRWLLDETPRVGVETMRVPNGPKPRYYYQVGAITIASGDSEDQVTMAMNHFRDVLRNLSEVGTREAGYVDEARSLQEIENRLIEQNAKLLQHINEVLAIPILPGECKYIRRAKEPFWPFRANPTHRVRTIPARAWLWVVGKRRQK